ncbi:putative glutamine rich protein [Penicillium digitatum]|uniref:Putative glutamine rich protein n=3 Tax=Penicillium digitatum TaxID=36651 RepID=K9H1V5_PEND2|nr:putative glutamine rich protein [Penicillium digitatum Pd1]EKV19136.1 putative glutamine rich protein [Penicillium digitatum PHI26]EKV20979.1 putative glutamine rich protein [Penicillium digitatum Pd1]QQK48370.1 putative glutamine rich protein [Penicillium digitatum]
MIQPLGKLMGARFVIENASGKIRLVSSAAAGGQLAIDGARSTGVPDTLRMEKDIHELQNFIRNMAGGTYGVNWVAIGEVDASHNKSPYMVVGFYFEGPGGNPPQQEYGISRSALKKILSSKAADRLISEAITYDPDMALQDAISSLSGLTLRSGTAPSHPSGGSNNYWNPMLSPASHMAQLALLQQPGYQNLLGHGSSNSQPLYEKQQLIQPSFMPQPGAQHLGAQQQLIQPSFMQQPVTQHLGMQPYSEDIEEEL